MIARIVPTAADCASRAPRTGSHRNLRGAKLLPPPPTLATPNESLVSPRPFAASLESSQTLSDTPGRAPAPYCSLGA